MNIFYGTSNLYIRKLCFFICFFSLFSSASSKEELVFSSGENTPTQKISEQVLGEAYKTIGHDIRVENLPMARSPIMSNNGQFDGELSRVEGINTEFSNLIPIPVAINFIEAHAFVKSNVITVSDWESLRPYRLVCVIGVTFIRQALEKNNIYCHYAYTFSQAIEMLQLGRVDIAVLPKISALAEITKTKTSGIKITGTPLVKLNLYHYLHKKNAAIIPSLTEALTKMQKNSRISEIRQAYLESLNLP